MKSEHEVRAHRAPQNGFVSLAAAAAPFGGAALHNPAPSCARSTPVKPLPPSAPEMAPHDVWERVRVHLRKTIGDDKFISWFGEANFEGLVDQSVVLSVSTKFLRSWIRNNYTDILLSLFCAEGLDARKLDVVERGSVVTSRISVTEPVVLGDGARRADECAIAAPARAAVEGSDSLGANPDKKLTFGSFMVGQSNIVAHAAASRIAQSLDHVQFNPLYIYGSVGLGKTHLLHALAHAAKESGKRVLYLTAEGFRFGFLKALTNRSAAAAFKETMRGFDLLLIDDLQFLQGKHTEAEFGHTLNALLDGSRQVVVACDRRPADLETFDERLRSRLGGGLMVQISLPEESLRRNILLAKAELERQRYPELQVPDGVISFMARSVDSNGRDLEGALHRLVHYHQLSRTPITVDMAEDIMRGFVRARDPKRVKIEDIIRMSAKFYAISRNDLLSSRRTRNVVLPRQIAMYLAKTMTPRSLPEIGGRFGNRDHTTVLHAVRKIENMLKGDVQLANDLDMLRQMILEA